MKKVTEEFFLNPTNGFTPDELKEIAQLERDQFWFPRAKGASHSIRRIA